MVMVGFVMGICQKCFVDTSRIVELARSIYESGCYDPGVGDQAQQIIKLIEDPIGSLPSPRGSVELTIAKRVIQYLKLDLLGDPAVLMLGAHGAPSQRWYQLDVPRGVAVTLMKELHERWKKAIDTDERDMFRRAYMKTKKSLGV